MASSWLPASPADSSTRADARTLWRCSHFATSATRSFAAARSLSPDTISTIDQFRWLAGAAEAPPGSARRASAESFQAIRMRFEGEAGAARRYDHDRPACLHHGIADLEQMLWAEPGVVLGAADHQQIRGPRFLGEKVRGVGGVRAPFQRAAKILQRRSKMTFAAADGLVQLFIVGFEHARCDHAVGMNGHVGKAGGDADHAST